MPAARIVVRGRVQGVGFRFFTQQTALFMGVAGQVWNRSDGSVEILAEHNDRTVLDAFARAIEGGPGYIRDVQLEPAEEKRYAGFEVVSTR